MLGLQQLQLPGVRAQAQQLWHTGLVALWQVGSSWTRDQTGVPCIARQILNHWTTREALRFSFILLLNSTPIVQNIKLLHVPLTPYVTIDVFDLHMALSAWSLF